MTSDRISIKAVPHRQYTGGFLDLPLVEDATDDLPLNAIFDQIDAHFYPPDGQSVVRKLDAEEQRWIERFADFLARCRGCYHW